MKQIKQDGVQPHAAVAPAAARMKQSVHVRGVGGSCDCGAVFFFGVRTHPNKIATFLSL